MGLETRPRLGRAGALALGALLAAAGTSADARAATAPQRAAEVMVSWRGQRFRADGPPPELGAGPRALVERWAGWAAEAEYELWIDASERVILFSAEARSRAKRDAKLVERTLELLDELCPAREREPRDDADRPGRARRDPDAPREPIALFDLRDARDQAVVLDRLAEHHPYLTSWIVSAKGLAGFTLEEPVAGAWLEEADDLEEHDPQHELVNRLARLVLVERFGRLPYWLDQGVAWYAEAELLRGIYCFPYRTGFVASVEHTGWDGELKRAFRGRASEPLRLEEVCDFKRGTFHAAKARASFGLVAFLAEHRPGTLGPILADLAELHERGALRTFDDGTWQRVPTHEVDAEAQTEVLQEHAGLDVLVEVTAFFREGKRYRPSRR